MATIYRCDRCGFETIHRRQVKTTTIPMLNFYHTDFTTEDDKYSKELCAVCTKNIYELMQPIPKEGK